MKLTIQEAQTILSKHLGLEVQIETFASYSDIPEEKQKEILTKSVREGSEDQKLLNANLKFLEAVKLDKTSGKDYIAEASDVFQSYIDSDFKNWKLDKEGEEKPETNLVVSELIKDATYKNIFTGDLDKLCLTQAQIIEFCENHKELLSSWSTFFLFKENNDFFVAYVYVNNDGLSVRVIEFADGNVWRAEYRHRVVAATDL